MEAAKRRTFRSKVSCEKRSLSVLRGPFEKKERLEPFFLPGRVKETSDGKVKCKD
jgi:hypothetical protein